MSNIRQDLRVAARLLRRQPGLAAAAILVLGLGIGATAAISSVVDDVLLTPPPFRDPASVVVIWASNPKVAQKAGLPDKLPAANGDLPEWQQGSHSFSHLALLQYDRMRLTGLGDPEQLGVTRVSGDFFSVLGTPAAYGRTLQPADDTLDKPRAVVLSYSYWRRRFGGDPRIVGRKLILNGDPLTVVGVMPPPFAFPRAAELPAALGFDTQPDAWVPLALSSEDRQSRSIRYGLIIGRLRPGVGIQQAEAELKAVCQHYAETHPASNPGWTVRLVPIAEQMVGDLRPALLVLWAAVGFVLLIACANVANLLLARAASREREVGVRIAVGASRGRLVAQLLTESALISLLGGALGLFLAWGGLRVLAATVPRDFAGAATFSLDLQVLAFTAALCLVTSLLTGLSPALHMARPDIAMTLRDGARGSTGVAGNRTRSALIVAEVALAVLLLIGAGLLLRSYARLLSIDPGFRSPDRLLTFEIDLPQDRYTPAQEARFFERAVERLRAIPGVTEAGAIDELPLTGFESLGRVEIEGQPPARPEDLAPVDWHTTFAGYLETMKIPLHAGRFLTLQDSAATLPVAVIDEGMAKTYWPGANPLGKRFRRASAKMGANPYPWISVVGVVGTVRHSSLDANPRPQLYQPGAQTAQMLAPIMPYQVEFALRTPHGDPLLLAAAARAAVREIDPDQPITDVRTMTQLVATSVAKRRFSLLLLSLFAGLALVLSVAGIYGITSYSVAQKTRELGLRLALGALPAEVLRLVLLQAGALAGLGVLVGVVAALLLTPFLAALLYGVGRADPLTYAGVALGLTLVALIAAYLPGRRAMRVDPLVALRNE
jgi:putative ABC transport system permease protein